VNHKETEHAPEAGVSSARAIQEPVAGYRHFAVFLGIVVVNVLAGVVAQQRQAAGGEFPASHADVISIYVSVTLLDWFLVYFVWRGIRRRGVTILSLIGGRWTNAREVLRDAGIAFCFWGVLMAVVWLIEHVVGTDNEEVLNMLLPRTPAEVMVWLVTASSAGFCEEFVFRGYVQRQLLAMTRRQWVSVLGQGVIFGVMHFYQGWKSVVVIFVIGVLLGALAVWRKSLRPGMIAHGWLDIWSGWLSNVIMH
jgi:membrane protease YdiL (CAAX protease family)